MAPNKLAKELPSLRRSSRVRDAIDRRLSPAAQDFIIAASALLGRPDDFAQLVAKQGSPQLSVYPRLAALARAVSPSEDLSFPAISPTVIREIDKARKQLESLPFDPVLLPLGFEVTHAQRAEMALNNFLGQLGSEVQSEPV